METFSNIDGVQGGSAVLKYTFPFEGNGNKVVEDLADSYVKLEIHFPVWREWKRNYGVSILFANCLEIHFPVWREWKLLFIWFDCRFDGFPAWNTLSRLKGMETKWKIVMDKRITILEIHFPVWREWKLLSVFNAFDNIGRMAWNTLSRLKGMETFGYVREEFVSYCRALDTRSRLKGMETNR